jgi:hypothetical protein
MLMRVILHDLVRESGHVFLTCRARSPANSIQYTPSSVTLKSWRMNNSLPSGCQQSSRWNSAIELQMLESNFGFDKLSTCVAAWGELNLKKQNGCNHNCHASRTFWPFRVYVAVPGCHCSALNNDCSSIGGFRLSEILMEAPRDGE